MAKKGSNPADWPKDWEALSAVIGAAIEVGLLTEAEASLVAQFTRQLMDLVAQVYFDPDSTAAEQIQAIHKLLNPTVYRIPPAAIKELATKYPGTAALARAVTVRRIMWRVAPVLAPDKPDAVNLLDGTVHVRPLGEVEAQPREHTEAIHAEALGAWKPGVTLQSLAIRIYLQETQGGYNEDAAGGLRGDLRKLAAWEIQNTPGQGAAARPTAPLWRLLAPHGSRHFPEDLIGALKNEAKAREKGGGKKGSD